MSEKTHNINKMLNSTLQVHPTDEKSVTTIKTHIL